MQDDIVTLSVPAGTTELLKRRTRHLLFPHLRATDIERLLVYAYAQGAADAVQALEMTGRLKWRAEKERR